MSAFDQSLILIGMPGAGKSTLGLLLAKHLAKDFVDTDLLIQLEQRRTLHDILREQGHLTLRDTEEKILLNAHYPNHVIATGGSAVYSAPAMRHLKQFGPIIFLDVGIEALQQRFSDMNSRGVARAPEQTFADVFAERYPLYLQYADIVIDCRNKSIEQLIDEIICHQGQDYASTQDA